MEIKNVLVTDGQYFHDVGIVRYLGKNKLNVFAVGNSRLSQAAYSKFCKGYFQVPLPDSSEYIPTLENLIQELNIDMLIPVGFQSTLTVAKHKERLKKITSLEIADAESIELALNKKRTYELAQRLEVPYPKTLFPTEIKEIEDLADQIGYPLVIKGLFEAGGYVVTIVKNRDELRKEYAATCEKHNFEPGSLPMLQEFLGAENKHFVVCLLYQNGKCKRLFIHHRIRKGSKFGLVAYGVTNIPPAVYHQIKPCGIKLLDELNWHGVACIEFRLDTKSNVPKLFEINPKFWASLDMALRAGVNFPYLLCEMAAGKELDYSEDYNHNMKFQYMVGRDLKQLKWNPKSLPNYILNVLNPGVKCNVMLSDLKPNLIEFSQTLASLFLPAQAKTWLKRTLIPHS